MGGDLPLALGEPLGYYAGKRHLRRLGEKTVTATVATLDAILPATLLNWEEVRCVRFQGEGNMVPEGSEFTLYMDEVGTTWRDLQVAVLMADLDAQWGGADCRGWLVRCDHEGSTLTVTLTDGVFSLR